MYNLLKERIIQKEFYKTLEKALETLKSSVMNKVI